MAKVENANKVIAKLRALAAKATKSEKVSVAVGYTQQYALYVHENLEAKHPVGQAKFLEEPFRNNARKYAAIIANAVKSGMTLAQGLLMAGLECQRDSQLLVPVDTGALKGSAFTRLEKGE